MIVALAYIPFAFGFGLSVASLRNDIPRAIAAYRSLAHQVHQLSRNASA